MNQLLIALRFYAFWIIQLAQKKRNDLTLLANEFTRSLKLRHRPTPYRRVGLLCTQHNTVPYRYDLGARLVNLSLTPCLLALRRLFKESRDPLLYGRE